MNKKNNKNDFHIFYNSMIEKIHIILLINIKGLYLKKKLPNNVRT
jgi:hypothetical protein